MPHQCQPKRIKTIESRKSPEGSKFQVVRHRVCLDCGRHFFTREIEDPTALPDLSNYHYKLYYSKQHPNHSAPPTHTISVPPLPHIL